MVFQADTLGVNAGGRLRPAGKHQPLTAESEVVMAAVVRAHPHRLAILA